MINSYQGLKWKEWKYNNIPNYFSKWSEKKFINWDFDNQRTILRWIIYLIQDLNLIIEKLIVKDEKVKKKVFEIVPWREWCFNVNFCLAQICT
jgi:hypothetical protein